jgi:hypothetical protein
MDRKVKNTIGLLVLLFLVVMIGVIYNFVFLESEIEEKTQKIAELNLNAYNTEDLLRQLAELESRVAELDSILALRKYNIPVNIPQSKFYDFINKITFSFSADSYVNVEYEDETKGTNFHYFTFRVSGISYYNEFFKLLYAIEQGKELKKVDQCSIDDNVSVDDDGVPHYKVSFTLNVLVYYSNNDNFASASFVENNLRPNTQYDIFYPLIRENIPPNVEERLDVQTAQLLALIPDGAFLIDGNGRSFVLWEGDQVYLGYLTQIDYNSNQVHFVLNKGGIIEKVTIALSTENNSSE